MTGTLEHRPLPEVSLSHRKKSTDHQSPPPEVELLTEEEVEDTQPCSFNDQVKKRLDDEPSYTVAASLDSGQVLRSSLPRIGEGGPDAGDSAAPPTLEDLRKQLTAVAHSVNLIEHQFKVRTLARLGALEKQLEEDHEKLQKCSETVTGQCIRLSNRKGVPCDVIERLDSMVGFCYAFCKGMEDAGIFALQKFAYSK